MTERIGPTIDLQLPGPSEARWASAYALLPEFDWPACERVVVVSPHPDDETLGAGGLIVTARERDLPVLILSVTDGEAASPDPGLAEIRRAELAAAVACLDPTATTRTVRLGFADSRVAGCVGAITESIGGHITDRDLVVCPLPDDGHPDHRGTASAAAAAAGAVGAALWGFPVWAWHCHDPGDTAIARGERLSLSTDALERKRLAVACFASQTAGASPVVPAVMLARLLRPFEVLVPTRRAGSTRTALAAL